MKALFSKLVVLVLLVVSGSTGVVLADETAVADAAKIAEFNVATYNLRQKNRGDSLKGDGWNSRCPVIAALVRFHEFHIFGTQEHSAIFYDTTMFDLLDHGDFWFSETPDRPGRGWDAACVRICSWGKFRHRKSGKEFRFFNLHLDHVGKKARSESVRLVMKKMQEAGDSCPTFLTGDFNVSQNNGMYKELAASDMLHDAFTQAGFVYALNGTYNGYRTDGYTPRRIDHIFVSDGITVDLYGILTDTYRTPAGDKTYRPRVPSDHFPIKIKVRL